MTQTDTIIHTCLCCLCLRNRQILMVRNYGNDAAKRQLIDDLSDELDHAKFDNDYWEAIKSGSWPGARQIAENIIRRCDALNGIATMVRQDQKS